MAEVPVYNYSFFVISLSPPLALLRVSPPEELAHHSEALPPTSHFTAEELTDVRWVPLCELMHCFNFHLICVIIIC